MPAKDGDEYLLNLGSSGSVFRITCAVSPLALHQGFSGQPAPGRGKGMLFIFPDIKIQSMWMPEMLFPLDIVWLDENLSVVHITYGATPCVTRKECPSYSSRFSSKYAIEMEAGDAARYGFASGMSLSVA